jgi:hypothetical protein
MKIKSIQHFWALCMILATLSCSPAPTASNGQGISEAEALKQAVVSPIAGNQAPIIQGLSANPTAKVSGNAPISFTLQAHDPDGDRLSYFWNSDQGTLETQSDGLSAFWRAEQTSQQRIANIDVVVSDGKGGQTQGNVKVFVDANGQAQVKYIARQDCGEGADRYHELFKQ